MKKIRSDFSKKFWKQYSKLLPGIQKKFSERLVLFEENPWNPVLRLHQLKGKQKHLMSIDVTGDYRALFRWDNGVAMFRGIGRHRDLYGE